MGVTGLWRLIDPSGKPVPLETLEGKVLAIDISIWIYQVLQGYQDKRGHSIPNAHLLGLYHRICKLLYFKIKPVFVFDGGVPLLKRNTIAQRKKQKAIIASKAEKMKSDLLQTLVKRNLVKGSLPEVEPSTSKATNKSVSDMFKLPSIPDINSSVTSGSDSEPDDPSPRKNTKWKGNIHSVDINSHEFKALPPDVRYDILTDLKETRKQNSWGRLHEIPEESNQFSNYQMKRLLKRRHAQESLEAAEREMGGKTLTLEELEKLMAEQGVDTKGRDKVFRIASDDKTRMIYINDPKGKSKEGNQPIRTGVGCSKASEDLTVIPEGEGLGSVVDNLDDYDLEESWEDDPGVKEGLEGSTRNQVQANCTRAGCSKTPDDLTIIPEGDSLAPAVDNIDDYDLEEEWDDDIEMIQEITAVPKRFFGKVKLNPAMSYMMENTELSQEQILLLIEQSKETLRKSKAEERAKKRKSGKSRGKDKKVKFQADFDVWKYVDVKKEVETPDEDSGSDLDVKEDVKDEGSSEEPKSVTTQKPEEKVELSSDSDSDDFVEVGEVSVKPPEKKMEIVIKETDEIEDDLFADVFEPKSEDVSLNSSSGYKSFDSSVIEERMAEARKDMQEEVMNAVDKVKRKLELGKKNEEIIELSEDDEEAEVKSEQKVISAAKTEVPEASGINHQVDDHKQVPKNLDIPKTPEKSLETPEIPEEPSRPVETSNLPESPQQPEQPSKPTEPSTRSSSPIETSAQSFPESSEQPEEQEQPSTSSSSGTTTSVPPIPEKPPKPSRVTSIFTQLQSEKSDLLSKLTNQDDLETLRSQLDTEADELKDTIGKLEHKSIEITEQMRTDAQELLRLFGIPYVVAPQEAEAQCAYLELINLTDGTVTDDSDIWLFGGRCVYKNFFNNEKRVMQYLSKDIEHHFKLTRNQMIQLALLVGSDYTVGIPGIGPVTALEVLASFPGEGDDLLRGLTSFASWMRAGRVVGPGKAALRNKLKNVEVDRGFPSQAVVQAYLFPTVDESRDTFTWGKPNLVLLADYTRQKFGWTKVRFDEVMGPVMKRLEGKAQKDILAYFKVKTVPKTIEASLSKRVQKAVERLGRAGREDDEDDVGTQNGGDTQNGAGACAEGGSGAGTQDGGGACAQGGKKKRRVTKKKMADVTEGTEGLDEVSEGTEVKKPAKMKKEVIPQREKDRAEALKKKLQAIEVFRKSHKGPGKSRGRPVRPAKNVVKKQAELSESSSDGD